MADEKDPKLEEGQEGAAGAGAESTDDGKKPEGQEGGQDGKKPEADDGVKDSHGQPGINKERHDKEVAELKAEIEKLKADAADAAEQKSKREEYEKKAADLEAKLADSEVKHSLEMLGCRNVKAAKALLEDYDGDVAKLKEGEPYLFAEEEEPKPKGQTGKKPAGAPGGSIDEKLDEAFGLKKK